MRGMVGCIPIYSTAEGSPRLPWTVPVHACGVVLASYPGLPSQFFLQPWKKNVEGGLGTRLVWCSMLYCIRTYFCGRQIFYS